MPASDLSRFTPDTARVGENIARTLRIIAKLLLDWCSAEAGRTIERRNQQKGRPGGERDDVPALPALTAIYFDKLAMSFCRIWDRLHEQGKARFRAGLWTKRGFHGPGKALKISRTEEEKNWLKDYPDHMQLSDYAFTTEVVAKLKPSLGNARILFRVDGDDPRSATCKVYPELDGSLWEAWLKEATVETDEAAFLTSTEHCHVQAISSALALLDKEELRALGTHYSAEGTCRDIEFNLKSFGKNYAELSGYLRERSGNAAIAAYRMVTTSREIVRKSGENRGAYDAATQKVWRAVQAYQDVRDAVKSVHQRATEIWDNQRVKAYRDNSPLLLDLSVYCRRGLSELGGCEKLSEKELAESNEALSRLQANLSGQVGAVWSYTEIVAASPQDWADSLERLRGEILRRMPPLEEFENSGVP
jgi:hypothetical protein